MALMRDMGFLFSSQTKRRVAVLFVAMVFTALMEVAGVASIMPFMMALKDPGLLQQNKALVWFGDVSGLSALYSLRSIAGVAVLVLLVLTNISWLFTNWLVLRFSHGQVHSLSSKLLHHYVQQPYAFFLGRNSADLGKNILSEVSRCTVGVILPLLQLLSKLVVILFLVGLLLFVNPVLAFTSTLIIGAAYSGIYFTIRKRLSRYGKDLSIADSHRFKAISELFGGIKEVKLMGCNDYFEQRFAQASRRFAQCYTLAESMATLPRYVLEMIAFGGIISIALYLLSASADPSDVLPMLALYAFVGYRLMPAMQQIYYCIAKIRYNHAALDHVVRELQQVPAETFIASQEQIAPLQRALELQNIDYSYPGSPPILRDISLEVQANTTIGLAGMSGAGKTTLVDILLGLLRFEKGEMKVDGTRIDDATLAGWQSQIGYVPQHIYLLDDTIASNIAFGIASENIDRAQLEKAAKQADLHKFIASLPQGYETHVGEKGVRLSGGQRQRIGIARALYPAPRVLVFDEATSALDSITESAVMEALNAMTGQMTLIIIAHRLSTLKQCHVIHLLEKGQIVASGTYDALSISSPQFRRFIQTHENEPGEAPH